MRTMGLNTCRVGKELSLVYKKFLYYIRSMAFPYLNKYIKRMGDLYALAAIKLIQINPRVYKLRHVGAYLSLRLKRDRRTASHKELVLCSAYWIESNLHVIYIQRTTTGKMLILS